MADELTPENKAIVARHRSPPAGDPAISIRPADLNRMLDAARDQGPGEAVAYRSRQRNLARSGKPGPWNYWDGTEVVPTSDSVYEAEALGVIAATPTREA